MNSSSRSDSSEKRLSFVWSHLHQGGYVVRSDVVVVVVVVVCV